VLCGSHADDDDDADEDAQIFAISKPQIPSYLK
jgi:hypothetical protein